jgi:hypothetical protein
MEVAMTRTAIRHTLFALAAAALVSAFTGGPASAQGQPTNEGVADVEPGTPSSASKPKTPKGLATKKGAPKPSEQSLPKFQNDMNKY